MTTTLIEYSRELLPKLRELNLKKQILAEWKTTDAEYLEFAVELKEVQERAKKYVEDKEAELLGEIKALQIDSKLAIKAACKASGYKTKELKPYFEARAKEVVQKAVEKGNLFAKLDGELA